MIYSNFPKAMSSVNSRNNYGYIGAKIVLGNADKYRENISILSPVGITLEKGMNRNLNFAFSKSASLMIKRYDEDWKNADDPCWNIPEQLFLVLTSNIYNESKPSAFKYRNGLVQTLRKDALSHFKMFARVNCSVGRNGFYCFGIYKVLTKKPSVIRILPPGEVISRILILHNNIVVEYDGDDVGLLDALDNYNLPRNLLQEDWATL